MSRDFQVLICDPDSDQVDAMEEFIESAYQNYNVCHSSIDVSDVSGEHDEIYEYNFASEKDALMFILKFGGHLTK